MSKHERWRATHEETVTVVGLLLFYFFVSRSRCPLCKATLRFGNTPALWMSMACLNNRGVVFGGH